MSSNLKTDRLRGNRIALDFFHPLFVYSQYTLTFRLCFQPLWVLDWFLNSFLWATSLSLMEPNHQSWRYFVVLKPTLRYPHNCISIRKMARALIHRIQVCQLANWNLVLRIWFFCLFPGDKGSLKCIHWRSISFLQESSQLKKALLFTVFNCSQYYTKYKHIEDQCFILLPHCCHGSAS